MNTRRPRRRPPHEPIELHPVILVVVGIAFGIGMLLVPLHSNAAFFLGFCGMVSMLLAFIIATLNEDYDQRPKSTPEKSDAPQPPPQGFTPEDVDQVLATMPDISPEARNAVHMLLKAHLHERKS